MNRGVALLNSAVFLILAPGTVAGWIPWLISRWRFDDPFLHFYPSRLIGAVLIIAGLPPLVDSFLQFALKGFGTPAPILPTRDLVVSGLYRYVRNPMYLSVLSLVIGQAFLFGNERLLIYAAFVAVCFHCFVILYEEPKLRRTFHDQYEDFCANVPRWLPRFHPWKQNHSNR